MRLPDRLLTALHRHVDGASLAVLRIGFGVVMVWEIARYVANDWIREYYAAPKLFFSYPLFDFVEPLPGAWLYVHFGVLAVAAALIALGLYTRAAAAVFALGFAWWFLSDQTRYLNHFYLILLISILLAVVPTDAACSLAARAQARAAREPRDETAPMWAVWLLRFQIGVPYFFGGIAKLNPDWFAGEPVRMWLAKRRDMPVVGQFFGEEWCVSVFVWGGLLLDLLIVPALVWRRTRVVAFLAAVAFHGTNAIVFRIGIFPWLMMAATTIFFEPGWPRRLPFLRSAPPVPRAPSPPLWTPATRAGFAALALWVSFQSLFPLRHWLYPGAVSWTEEGHLFSWRMKLRDKGGSARFTVLDPATGGTFEIAPRDYLTKKQAEQMATHPDMLLQFAHHLAREFERNGHEKVEVRARVRVALNGRRRQLLIDPTVDLAVQPRTLWRWDWIVPLSEPIRRN